MLLLALKKRIKHLTTAVLKLYLHLLFRFTYNNYIFAINLLLLLVISVCVAFSLKKKDQTLNIQQL